MNDPLFLSEGISYSDLCEGHIRRCKCTYGPQLEKKVIVLLKTTILTRNMLFCLKTVNNCQNTSNFAVFSLIIIRAGVLRPLAALELRNREIAYLV